MDYIKKEYEKFLTILKEKETQLYLLYLLSFLIPFLFKTPQLLIGSLVNMVLIVAVTNFSLKEIYPVLILPSITSFLNGVLLGNLTTFLLYLIPFIVLANTVYVLVYKKSNKGIYSILLASVLKAGILFTTVNVLYGLDIVPRLLLKSMGIIQLTTALIGGAMGYLLTRQLKK